MRDDDTSRFGVVRNGVLTLSGYGCRLSVERGALRVQDGIADTRVDIHYQRVTCGISRVVITGHEGEISLSAIRWLHDIGASLVQLDRDGSVLLTTAPAGTNFPALRRAQALAANDDRGRQITRYLLGQKLAGQAKILAAMGQPDRAAIVSQFRAALDTAPDSPGLRLVEAQAAVAYWQAWESVPVPFARRDASRVPEHWRTFGPRTSPLTRSPRRAATPGHALLNYLYAILEAEARVACLTVGLDPGIGILHADQARRDSLALDVMEAVRPQVDRWLLDWLRRTPFAARDFVETRDGTVRVLPTVTRQLTATGPQWGKAVGPFAEAVAQMLVGDRTKLATPMSEANRSRGRTVLRQARFEGIEADTAPQPETVPPGSSPSSSSSPADTARPSPSRSSSTCLECGAPISGRRKYCSDACRQAYARHVLVQPYTDAAQATLAALRASGDDPAHGGEAGQKRGASNRKRYAERAAWEAKHGDGQEERARFIREIQPKLADVPVERIAAATELTLPYASLIRRGRYVPHPMHCAALAVLVDGVDRH